MQTMGNGARRMLVLERGENVHETILAYCRKEHIGSASFHAVGAVQDVEIGYYDLHKREYFFAKPEGEFEVASMNGNIALVYPEDSRGVDGVPFAHIHAVLSACDISCATMGGHVKSAVVAVTLEVSFTVHDFEMGRALNEEVGLKLLCPLS